MPNVAQDAPVTIVTQPHEQVAAVVAPRGHAPFLSREQILEATVACFAEDGYDGTTIRAIAARLGCSVGSIYRYFTDKRELLLACGERAMRPVVRELEGGTGYGDSLRGYLRAAVGNSELYRLQFWLASIGGQEPGLPPVVARIIEGWAEMLGDRGEAERRWAAAHGLLMLGWTEERIVAEAPTDAATAVTVPPYGRFSDEAEDMTLL